MIPAAITHNAVALQNVISTWMLGSGLDKPTVGKSIKHFV